jgi:hypothetical protein
MLDVRLDAHITLKSRLLRAERAEPGTRGFFSRDVLGIGACQT